MIHSKIKYCRASQQKDLIKVCSFSDMYLTGTFPKKNQIVPKTPVEIVFSKSSKLLQLNHNYDEKKLYGPNYGYRSGLNPVMVNHLKQKYVKLKKNIKLKKGDYILDIGSNDSTFLNFFINTKNFGVDPTIKKYYKFYKKNTIKLPSTFEKSFKRLKNKKFKLISAIAMFYDIREPVIFLKKIKTILDTDGIFHIEVAYLPEIIKTFSYDTFCQEHYEYYSLISLNYLIEKTDLKIFDFGFNKINGGSIWLNIGHKNAKIKKINQKFLKQIKFEKKNKIDESSTYKKYFQKVKMHGKNLKKLIQNLKKKNKKVAGIGASTKGNVLLQLSGLENNNLSKIYDINPYKFGRYTPYPRIKIENETKIKIDQPDYLLVLIWHFDKFIINKIKKQFKKIKLIIPFPKIKII
jgi:hypothetical protein